MERIRLTNGSFEKIALSGSKELEIYVEANACASLYLYMSDHTELNAQIILEENAQLKSLFWNECNDLKSTYTIVAHQNSSLDLNLGEMSEGEVNSDIKIYLREENSSLHLRSASTVSHRKHFEIECIHEAPHTQSNMENYAVVNKQGDFKMLDTGKILKGAYDSHSHQASHALILSADQKCEITPVLLIDENDVQASHATTMGQIDENQLYYLQTRGLTKTQALGLITVGYLMPVASVLDDEDLNQELSIKIEKKVGLS